MLKYDRILVCGGRNFNEEEFIFDYLDYKSSKFTHTATIINGYASGADKIARDWALDRGYSVEDYPADWNDIDHPDAIIAINKWGKVYNRNAGFIRNQKMLEYGKPELVIAFPGGGGTQDMVERSLKVNLDVIRVKVRKL